MWGLDGRTVLVTGASGGIGGATVRQLMAAGATVIASGRSTEALDALAAQTGCQTLPFDLTSEDSIRGALLGLDLWGVVNCGGFGGEIAATIAEEAFEELDAPVRRLAAPDSPVPFAPSLEKAFIPQVDDVAAALRELAAY